MTAPPVPGHERPRAGSSVAVSHRLLVELVTSSLDPGYAAAATRRRGESTPARWYDRLAVALGCALAGFVLVVAYVHTHRDAPLAARVHDDLVDRVRSGQSAADALSNRLDALTNQLNAARASVLPDSEPLVSQLAQDQLDAGLVAVHGPGMTVTLAEPEQSSPSTVVGRGGATPITATNILTDRDVRSVVNELWHDGAEAIAVNGIRLTPTSAVRFAGEAVLVDFQPITSPYSIDAIGNTNQLITAFAESAVASRYKTLSGADGIGFGFGESGDLQLPAGGPEATRYATGGHR